MDVSSRVLDALTALFLMAAVLFAACVLFGRPSQPAVAACASGRPVLVIDAGHGGEDGGAVSLSGVPESRINLAIARRLDLIFGLLGTDTVMLRSEDVSLHSEGAVTLRQKKVSDLHNRVDTIQSLDGAILLSIHQNSYPDPRYHGAQAFYAPTAGSAELAQLLQETLRQALEPENDRQAKQIQDTIYLMNHISCPAVLVECGFLTNAQEERRLLDGTYQTRLAAALAGGCLQYLTSLYTGGDAS